MAEGTLLLDLIERLGVRRGERRAVLAAGAFQIAFVAGVAVLKAATNALVLSRWPDPRTLAALYVVTAVATAVYFATPHRGGAPKASLLGWGALLGLLALAVPVTSWAVPALYVVAELYGTAASVRFWAALGERFDVRASRRLFAMVAGCGTAGSILGGLFLRAAGPSMGALALVPAAAATVLPCLVFSALLGAVRREPSAAAPRPFGVAPRRAVARYLLGDPFPRTVALVAALLAIASTLVDYVFRLRAQAAYTEANLAALFGDLNLVVGIAAALFQILLAGPLLQRVGIFRYFLAAPAGYFVAALAAVFSPGLWPAFALKSVETAGNFAVARTGLQLLYGPMPEEMQASARGAIDAFASKGGVALAGLALLALGAEVPDRALAAAVAVLAAVGGVFIVLLRRLYVRAVGERLASRGGPPEPSLVLADGTARGALAAALAHPDERRALTALELLARDPVFDFSPRIGALLTHSSERVREQAARLAGERRIAAAAARLAEMADSDARRPRDEAVRALGLVAPEEARRKFRPLLGAEDPGLRCAAIAALLPLGDAEAKAALEALVARGAAAPAAERREVAKLLGRPGAGPWSSRIAAYINDEDATVARLACAAAGEARDPLLVQPLIEAMGGYAARGEARTSLARYGDAVSERLQSILYDRKQPLDLRLRIPRLLRYIGTDRAAKILLYSDLREEPLLRYRVALALWRLWVRRPEVSLDEQRLRDATLRRVKAYQYYLPVFRDLQRALPEGAILLRAVGDRLDQNLEIIFRLIGLLHRDQPIINAYHRFIGGEARDRAYAMEIIEHVASESTAGHVLPLLEEFHRLPADADDGLAARAPARLMELMVSRDDVLRACAIHTARRVIGSSPAGDAGAARVLAAAGGAFLMPAGGPVSQEIIEKVFFLEGVDIFAHSSVDDLAALAALLYEQRWQAGETIYRENDAGDALYIVVEGKVRVEKDAKPILTLGEKESFGQTSLLDNKPRPATVVAETAVQCLVLDRGDFMDLVADRVELLKGVFTAITRHLRSVLEVAAAGRITAPGEKDGEKAA